MICKHPQHCSAEFAVQDEGSKWDGRFAEIMVLDVIAEVVRAGTHLDSWRRRIFQIVGAATLKLWVPNEVWTNGRESSLCP